MAREYRDLVDVGVLAENFGNDVSDRVVAVIDGNPEALCIAVLAEFLNAGWIVVGNFGHAVLGKHDARFSLDFTEQLEFTEVPMTYLNVHDTSRIV